MKRLSATCAALAASAASAQPTQISYKLRFVEVAYGTNTPVPAPDGILQAGEAARIELSVMFSPPVGTTLAYTPPPPPGVGEVAGLSFVCFNVQGTPNAHGTWSFMDRAPGWNLFPGITTPTSVEALNVWQFPSQGQTANSTNPIESIWHGVWTPLHYQPRTVRFDTTSIGNLCERGPARLYLKYGSEPGTGHPYYVDVPVFSNLRTPIDIPIASCYPNCDASTVTPTLNVADFICFLNRFAAGNPYANCDASTTAPLLNVNDFTCFTNAFAAGCS